MTLNASPCAGKKSKRSPVAGRRVMTLSLSISLAFFAACGPPPQPYIWGSTHPSLKTAPPAHQLGPSDKFYVFVSAQAELSGEHTVSPEGEYVQPLLGTIRVTGMTTDQLKQLLRQKLARFVSNPEVSVTLTQARELRVTALGEVREPGQFLVPADESLLGVIGRARGLTEFADSASIYVVRRSPKTERIRFRFENLVKPDSTVTFRLQDGDSIVVE